MFDPEKISLLDRNVIKDSKRKNLRSLFLCTDSRESKWLEVVMKKLKKEDSQAAEGVNQEQTKEESDYEQIISYEFPEDD